MPGRNQQVDFYILQTPGENAARRFTCRLVDQVFRQGHRVLVRLASLPELQAFDQELWTFAQGSFVPHAAVSAPEADETPVLLGLDTEAARADVLVNLGDDIPAQVETYARVAEVVPGDEQGRRAGRERFRHYRERGFTIKTHDIR